MSFLDKFRAVSQLSRCRGRIGHDIFKFEVVQFCFMLKFSRVSYNFKFNECRLTRLDRVSSKFNDQLIVVIRELTFNV